MVRVGMIDGYVCTPLFYSLGQLYSASHVLVARRNSAVEIGELSVFTNLPSFDPLPLLLTIIWL